MAGTGAVINRAFVFPCVGAAGNAFIAAVPAFLPVGFIVYFLIMVQGGQVGAFTDGDGALDSSVIQYIGDWAVCVEIGVFG